MKDLTKETCKEMSLVDFFRFCPSLNNNYELFPVVVDNKWLGIVREKNDLTVGMLVYLDETYSTVGSVQVLTKTDDARHTCLRAFSSFCVCQSCSRYYSTSLRSLISKKVEKVCKEKRISTVFLRKAYRWHLSFNTLDNVHLGEVAALADNFRLRKQLKNCSYSMPLLFTSSRAND